MCGIIAIAAKENIVAELMLGLKRLEYRGYDSAGIAVCHKGEIEVRKAIGQLHNLEKVTQNQPLKGSIGIAHTRWATHGKIEEKNCHPLISQDQKLAIVHNGIIENCDELRSQSQKKGYKFSSDTDTEVCLALLTCALQDYMTLKEAFSHVLGKLKGYYSLALLASFEPGKIYVARFGCPLCIGIAQDKTMIASDAVAIENIAHKICYLEDGDIAIIDHQKPQIFNQKWQKIDRKFYPLIHRFSNSSKGNYQHFMLKEIHEQPEVATHAIGKYVDSNEGIITLPDFPFDISKVKRIILCGCGTAYYVGLMAKYWLEKYANIQVQTEAASELRSGCTPLDEDCLGIFVSQSGETLDTLFALRAFKEKKIPTLAIVNVPMSTIMREADFTLQTYAGHEVGVASTKATLSQLVVLAVFAIELGMIKKQLQKEYYKKIVQELLCLPRLVRQVLAKESDIARFCKKLSKRKNALFIGRNICYPLALEGALKLKEISYIHAEGYRAGELKHGPLALVDEDMPVVAIAPSQIFYNKMLSSIHEAIARGCDLVFLSDRAGIDNFDCQNLFSLQMPATSFLQVPFAYLPALQLLSYHCAVSLGTDVDQPRNLAKSVTVE